jgi:hypothetical protein
MCALLIVLGVTTFPVDASGVQHRLGAIRFVLLLLLATILLLH